MKKLILSLMIVLGTTLGAQAQTFDFNCDTSIPDSGLPTSSTRDYDNTRYLIADGFSASQIQSLIDASFVLNGAGNTMSISTSSGLQSFIQYGNFGRRVVHPQTGPYFESAPYRVNKDRHGFMLFATAEEAIAFLLE